jgi:hypothetical protein
MGIISNKREIYSEFTEYFDPSFYMFLNGNLVLDDGESISVLEGTAPSGFQYTNTTSYQKDFFAIHNNIYVTPKSSYNVHFEGQISTDYSEINWVTRTNPLKDHDGTNSQYYLDKAFYLKGADKFIVAAEYNTASQYLRVAKASWPLSWSAYTLPNFASTATFYMANDVFVHMKSPNNNILEFTTDLITWTTSTSPAINGNNTGRYFVYSGSLYALQTGYSSTISDETPWTSTDLITWTQGALASAGSRFAGLAGGNRIFIKSRYANYSSSSDHPYRSTDCITWTKSTTPITYTGPGWREAFFNEAEERFEIHNNNPDEAGYAIVFYSTTDGVSWTIHSKPLPSDYAASLGDSSPVHLLALNNQTKTSQQNLADVIQRQGSDISENYDSILESEKEVDDKLEEKASLSGASFTGEVDVVSGTSIAKASTRQITYSGHDPIDGVGNSGDLWLKVVPNSLFVATAEDSQNTLASTDGSTWTLSTTRVGDSTNDYYYHVGYGNDTFITLPSNTNKFSSTADGINWTVGTVPVTLQWRAIGYGNGMWIAVANNTATYVYSTDTVTWTIRTLPQSGEWEDIAYGNGMWVIVEGPNQFRNEHAYSTDGLNWTVSTAGKGASDIIYAGDLFVCSGETPKVSTDGITWTQGTFSVNTAHSGIAYGNGVYVTVAPGQPFGHYSTDGLTWTINSLGHNGGLNWNCVAFSNEKFVALVKSSGSYSRSTDGVTWQAGFGLYPSGWTDINSNGF